MLANGIVIDGNISKDNTIKITIPQLFGDQQLDALICYDGKTEFNYKPGTSVIIGFLYHDSGNPIVLGTYEVDAVSETAKLNTSSISYQNSIGDRVDAEKEIKSVQKKIEENQIVESGGSDIDFTDDQWDAINSGVKSGLWVNTTSNQLINGLKDFNINPRVKVTHETHNLPSEYKEVEYLESDGDQYIKTGFTPSNNNYGFDIDLMVSSYGGTANAYIGYRCVNSAAISGNMRYCFIYGNEANIGKLAIRNGVQADNSTQNLLLDTKYNLNYLNGQLKVNNSLFVQSTGYSSSPTYAEFYLFKANTDGFYSSDLNNFIGRIYEAKLYDNNILIRDFIPCIRISDEEPGLYDIVNNTFYTNYGSGDFLCGSEIQPITYEELMTDANFATVAKTGDYNDLINKPSQLNIFNGELTIKRNGTLISTFTANSSVNVTANIVVPTKTSEITNDSGYITSSYHDTTKEDVTNKVTILSSSSTHVQYPSAKCVYDNVEDIREVAEGKKQTYVVSDVTNPVFNSQSDSITTTNNIVDINGETINLNNLNIGDTIYVINTDVPDRWISNKSVGNYTIITASKLETVKPNIASISVNNVNVPPVLENVNITVPTDTAELSNSAGYITSSVNNLSNYTLSSNLATVATSGSYDDLLDKPIIPTVNYPVTDVTIDGVSCVINTVAEIPALFDGDYNNLSNKPFIPTDTSDLANGAGFITASVNNLQNYTLSSNLSTVATSGSYMDLIDKPTIPTQTSQLNNNSGFITVSVDNLTNYTLSSDLSAVATSGSYNSLLDKPYIPTQTGDLNNNSGFITSTVNNLSNYTLSSSLSTVATSGSYNDLINKPTIPTQTSELNNNSGFITNSVNNLTNYTLSSSLATVATSGSYNDLLYKPTIPTDTNDLTNSAGFITGINSTDVITALGYTPYSSSNPNNYITASDIPLIFTDYTIGE